MSRTLTHKGLLTLAVTTWAACAPSPAPAQPPAGEGAKGVVPFELLVSNHMVVSAKLNGKGPYRLIFDLGAPITLLSNRASEGAGVVKAAAPRSLLFAMRGEATVDTLEVGTLKAEKLPVIVLDHPALRALGGLLGKPLDGIIGYTFFARYKTTIDYQSKTMTFEPVDHEVKDLMRELPNRLAGPKVARTKVLAPGGLFGFSVGEPKGSDGDSTGVPVLSVAQGSPAEAAGLKPGDVLTGLDGRWTASRADTFAAASAVAPGRPVELDVVREGKELTLTVTPAEGF